MFPRNVELDIRDLWARTRLGAMKFQTNLCHPLYMMSTNVICRKCSSFPTIDSLAHMTMSIYRAKRDSPIYEENFFEKLREIVSKALNEGFQTVLCGDFNLMMGERASWDELEIGEYFLVPEFSSLPKFDENGARLVSSLGNWENFYLRSNFYEVGGVAQSTLNNFLRTKMTRSQQCFAGTL